MGHVLQLSLSPVHYWLKLPLWRQIFVSLLLGAVVGLSVGEQAEKIMPLGQLFINAIHMMVVPVVCTVIIGAIVSIENLSEMRRLSIKAITVYALCMFLAIGIAFLSAYIIKPGVGGLTFEQPAAFTQEVPSLQALFVSIVPKNLMQAFLDANILQIVVFSLCFGIAIKLSGEKGEPVANMFKSLSEVIYKFVHVIMCFAPYGLFALIASTFGKFGIYALWALFKFVLTVYAACIIMFVTVYGFMAWQYFRISPVELFKRISRPFTFAYTTCSSAATLPISMQTAQEKFGTEKNVSEYLLPFGASFNLNGLSIYLMTTALFSANLYGIELNVEQYITLVITTFMVSMGVAAVPGSAILVMSVVLSSVNIPLGVLAIVAGVDRINDMIQTATNVAGDITTTAVIGESEKRL